MPLKEKLTRPRSSILFAAYLYRLPLPVKEILLFADGNGYPVCPRCDMTLDREYMEFCDRCGQHLSWSQFDDASVIAAPRYRR